MSQDAKIENTTQVWDLVVRIFHWGLVVSFFIDYFTRWSLRDLMEVHVWFGYVITVLLVIRLVWGFAGSRHALFSDFVYRPSAIFTYVKDIMALRAPRYIGHNPAGGFMIVVLLIMVFATCLTGIIVYGINYQDGPLATLVENISDDTSDFLEDLHGQLSNFTLLLVAIHLLGVVVESVVHHENLVHAMWTGKKRITAEE